MDRYGKKILVVDDSNTNNVLLEAILTNMGYTTLTAFSVEEAQSILNTEIPELILLDLLMPKVNGYEFLKSIKKNESTKNIPVIIVSAVPNAGDIKKSKLLGAIDYIEKPIDIHKLVTKIELTLDD